MGVHGVGLCKKLLRVHAGIAILRKSSPYKGISRDSAIYPPQIANGGVRDYCGCYRAPCLVALSSAYADMGGSVDYSANYRRFLWNRGNRSFRCESVPRPMVTRRGTCTGDRHPHGQTQVNRPFKSPKAD